MNCVNLSSLIFLLKKNNIFLIYTEELFLLYKIKNIIINIFKKNKYKIKIFDYNLFINEFKNLYFCEYFYKELIIVEIYYINLNLLNKINIFLKKKIFKKKIIIFIYCIFSNIEKLNIFKNILNNIFYLKIKKMNKDDIISLIFYQINLEKNKTIKLLNIFYNKLNNNILLIQEIIKLKIIFYKKKIIYKKIKKILNYKIIYNYFDLLKNIINLNFKKIHEILIYLKNNKSLYKTIFFLKKLLNNLLFNKKFFFYKKKFFYKNYIFKIKNKNIILFLIKLKKININFKNNLLYSDLSLIKFNWILVKNFCIKLMLYFLKKYRIFI